MASAPREVPVRPPGFKLCPHRRPVGKRPLTGRRPEAQNCPSLFFTSRESESAAGTQQAKGTRRARGRRDRTRGGAGGARWGADQGLGRGAHPDSKAQEASPPGGAGPGWGRTGGGVGTSRGRSEQRRGRRSPWVGRREEIGGWGAERRTSTGRPRGRGPGKAEGPDRWTRRPRAEPLPSPGGRIGGTPESQPRGRHGDAAVVVQLEHAGRVRGAQAAADLGRAGGAQLAGHQPPEPAAGAGGVSKPGSAPALLK